MDDNMKAATRIEPESRSTPITLFEHSSDQVNKKTSPLEINQNEVSIDKLINTMNSNSTKNKLYSTINHIDTSTNILSVYSAEYANLATTAPITVLETKELLEKFSATVNKTGTTDFCRPPNTKKFGHPCLCFFPKPSAEHPAYLYDPFQKKCLTTSATRPRLLKECSRNNPCGHLDLVCDQRKQKCNCKPSLHLYFEANREFGCIPLDSVGRGECKRGQFWSFKYNQCQKVFDIGEVQSSFQPVLSATQFSFVSIVILWILLLILILTAKLRKLRSIHTVRRQSTSGHRRIRHETSTTSQWLHPFITAVNGHHHLHSHTADRQSLSLSIDDPLANDSEVFLNNTTRGTRSMLLNGNFTSSNQSLNNPPPKFEEIYPHTQDHPSWNEDLPSYEEAIKMQNQHPVPTDHDNNGIVKVYVNGTDYHSFSTPR